MGSGKSTIGRGLAGSFNCRFIDLDHYMEDKWAMSVSAIFAKNGEEWFRKEECESLKEIVEEYRYLSSKPSRYHMVRLGASSTTQQALSPSATAKTT